MTDDELAEELEFHAKHGISAAPALQHEASERIRALSAHVALLKASLAQAEREADAARNAEPFGHFHATPFGWEECAATDEGAIALYERPEPVVSAGPVVSAEPVAWAHFAKNGNIRIWTSAAKEAVRIAKENGIELTPLYTEPQPYRVAELEAEVERLRTALAASCEDERGQLYESGPSAGGCARATAAEAEIERLRGWLAMLIDLYENGPACSTDPDGEGEFVGYAIHIADEPFKAICDWLNAHEQDGKEAQS